jgi:hypothetical protein
VNANKAVGPELVGHDRDGLSQQVRTGFALQQNIVSLFLYRDDIIGIDKEDAAVSFDAIRVDGPGGIPCN